MEERLPGLFVYYLDRQLGAYPLLLFKIHPEDVKHVRDHPGDPPPI